MKKEINMYKNREYFKAMVEDNKTVKEVAEINNVCEGTIQYWEKRHNLKLIRIPLYTKNINRKYFFNQDFFEEIDCEEKAYFLGLIMADGYISPNQRTISIALKREDEHILQKLLDCIGSESPLADKKNGKQKVLTIHSRKMVIDLERYSIKHNKTYTLAFPKLREDMYRHFIRGYFDGDGYIGQRQSTLVISSVVFLEEFLNFMKGFVLKEC